MNKMPLKNWRYEAVNRRSTAGASFLIALIFVLVATVVATVIITSSSVNVEWNKQHAAEEQSYLAVVSALSTAKESFLNDYSSLVVTSDTSDNTGNDIENWAIKRAKSMLNGTNDYTDSLTIYVTSANPYSNSTLQKVKLVYSMNSTCDITINGSIIDQDSSSTTTSNSTNSDNYVSTITDYDNTLTITVFADESSDATEVWWPND